MGQTIISAIGVYISTSIDYLIVLIILFAQLSQNKQKWHIYAGQYLGTGLLVGVSLVAAYVVNFVPEAWMVGLLGLIPIYLGIRFAIVGEGEEEEGAVYPSTRSIKQAEEVAGPQRGQRIGHHGVKVEIHHPKRPPPGGEGKAHQNKHPKGAAQCQNSPPDRTEVPLPDGCYPTVQDKVKIYRGHHQGLGLEQYSAGKGQGAGHPFVLPH